MNHLYDTTTPGRVRFTRGDALGLAVALAVVLLCTWGLA